MSYSIKMGRNLLRKCHPVPSIPQLRCQGVLPPTYNMKWKKVWNLKRASKEAGLIWQTWHGAVAVNEWRNRIAPNTLPPARYAIGVLSKTFLIGFGIAFRQFMPGPLFSRLLIASMILAAGVDSTTSR
jgi:hypothetical protein